MLLSLLIVLAQSAAHVPVIVASYIPERVYDSDRKRFTDFEAMLAELARADILFVGEQHDDPNTHRLELAILEGLARRRGNVTLALEMFDRDVQSLVSEYVAGSAAEDAFLKASRPWPRYATDYRPLVEFAKSTGWPIVASNVPRRLASEVAKGGLEALERANGDRVWYAEDVRCPEDDYFDRFVETMTSHPMPGAEKMPAAEQRAMVRRFYLSQCLKDETMAESVVRAREQGAPLVVHFNGAFHTDFGDGAAERVTRRVPHARVVVLSILPVENLDALKPSKQDRKRADYLVFTLSVQAGRPGL
ncbi:MAG: ChaN family lipoprotein [Vicinamibacterales bacterium]